MKPRILVTRTLVDELLDELRRHFEVDDSQPRDGPHSADELRSRIADKDGVLLFADRVDAALLDAAPRLKAACNITVGYNNVDVAACTARGILVTNAPGVLDDTTADMTWALLLAAARRIAESDRWLRAGNWKGMKFSDRFGRDVHHATLGILGMGRIGRAVARRAVGFDMRVIYHNRTRLESALETEANARYVGMDELLAQSDFLSLHLPYTEANRNVIGAVELARMKPTAILVNASRGGLVDEPALIAALREGRVAGAALDVFDGEPTVNRGFLGLDNVVLAPHMGSATRATRLAMARLAIENLMEALAGGVPRCLVNPEALARRRG
ncbi:MAG: D-glycerate dehydrogenase [Betaproteobacteria bacterium]|nr:D-glycerate dehydrogenase [Betaproteobacteria bacterium]